MAELWRRSPVLSLLYEPGPLDTRFFAEAGPTTQVDDACDVGANLKQWSLHPRSCMQTKACPTRDIHPHLPFPRGQFSSPSAVGQAILGPGALHLTSDNNHNKSCIYTVSNGLYEILSATAPAASKKLVVHGLEASLISFKWG